MVLDGAFSVQFAGKISVKTQHALRSSVCKAAVTGTPEVINELVTHSLGARRGTAEEAQTFGGDVLPGQSMQPSFRAAAGNPCAAGG